MWSLVSFGLEHKSYFRPTHFIKAVRYDSVSHTLCLLFIVIDIEWWNTLSNTYLKNSYTYPDWCASVGWASPHKTKGHCFNSWSGHTARLWVQWLVGTCPRGNQSMFLSLFISLLPPSLKIINIFKRHIYNEIFLGHEKEQNLSICNSMDGPRRYYAQWNKSIRERQIPYGFTYIWNLMNEMS